MALFVVMLSSGDDSPPRCPVSRTGAVDLVPGGPRPCVLYGAGHGTTTGTGTYQQGGSHSTSTSEPGSKTSTGKQPGAKAPAPQKPAAKVPAAPKAPAVKAPSLSKR
ncbi:hypothetical protein AB0I69_42660 [Streptomyces sp. NPDC050508]|uniref:hypothetical protein n=1 Tax=Streptomyces sp. NPDC050508 TaxID=3155405 RepID=UPI0034137B51